MFRLFLLIARVVWPSGKASDFEVYTLPRLSEDPGFESLYDFSTLVVLFGLPSSFTGASLNKKNSLAFARL